MAEFKKRQKICPIKIDEMGRNFKSEKNFKKNGGKVKRTNGGKMRRKK